MIPIARIPAERCYWAALAPIDGVRRLSRTQLEYQFETSLPCPLDEVQCAFLPLLDGRILACAVDRTELAAAIERDPDALRVTPDALPASLDDVRADPTRLNFRAGDFEPPILAKQRPALTRHVAGALLLITGVITGMLHHMTTSHNAVFSRSMTALDAELQRVFGDTSTSTQDPLLLMLAERDTLQRTRSERAPGVERPVTPELAALFDAWPADVPIQTETITCSPTTIALSALVEDNDAAERFRESLAGIEGWQLAQPRLHRTGNAVRVSLRLSRTGATP